MISEENPLRINEKIIVPENFLKYSVSAKKIIQSENNLLLLKFLALQVLVASRRAWTNNTLEWLESRGQRNNYGNLFAATHSIYGGFVHIRRVGVCDQINITDLGECVIGMRYPAWIRGKGWFGGFDDHGVIVVDNLRFLDLSLEME